MKKSKIVKELEALKRRVEELESDKFNIFKPYFPFEKEEKDRWQPHTIPIPNTNPWNEPTNSPLRWLVDMPHTWCDTAWTTAKSNIGIDGDIGQGGYY